MKRFGIGIVLVPFALVVLLTASDRDYCRVCFNGYLDGFEAHRIGIGEGWDEWGLMDIDPCGDHPFPAWWRCGIAHDVCTWEEDFDLEGLEVALAEEDAAAIVSLRKDFPEIVFLEEEDGVLLVEDCNGTIVFAEEFSASLFSAVSDALANSDR